MSKDNVVALKSKVQRWAERITAAYGDSVQAIVEVGRQLAQAKAECSHGEWGELTGQTTGKSLLPFTYRTAQRLKAIANNAALSNAAHAPHLPASWYTLAILASLDPDDIERAIADGAIRPEMERNEVESLKARLAPLKPWQVIKPLPFAPVDVGHMADPPMTSEQQAKLDAVRTEFGDKLREIGVLQQGAAARREENAWHNRHDPHTRGLALGVELVVGLSELVRLVRAAEIAVVLTPEQRIRASASLQDLSTLINEASQ